jgi:hypothetical protein
MTGAAGQDRFIRRLLWVSVVFNAGGASLFAFPASPIGQLIEMPTPVAPIYGILLAFFLLLFGAMYAFLAVQTVIYRPWVAFLAAGKLGAFAIVLGVWITGNASFRGVMAAAGDLILAILFVLWLLRSAKT